MKKVTEIEEYLRGLGLSWITIAEALSDGNYRKSYQLIKDNPKISKKEFLKKMEIEEIEY